MYLIRIQILFDRVGLCIILDEPIYVMLDRVLLQIDSGNGAVENRTATKVTSNILASEYLPTKFMAQELSGLNLDFPIGYYHPNPGFKEHPIFSAVICCILSRRYGMHSIESLGLLYFERDS